MMPSMKEELDQSTTPPLFKTSCGFYVNKETGGFCSSCYKADVLKKKASSEVPKIPDVNKNVDNQKPMENHHQSNEVVKKRNQCHVCSKRVGLVPFLCRCGESFCGLHRMPEEHACKFDFKAAGRVVIEKQNPLCVADKLEFRLQPCTFAATQSLSTSTGASVKEVNRVSLESRKDYLCFKELSDMVFQSYHGWENWLNKNVDNQRPVENHHQSNKVEKKKNRCRACKKRVSEIYKIISRRRNFSHGLQKQSSVIMDKADNIVVVKDLIVLTKGLGNLWLLIFEGFLGSIDCLFVIMSLHGYSDGDEYDNKSDVDNVTLIYKLDVNNPLNLHPNDFYHMFNALWKQFNALIELPRCTCHAADDFKKHNQLMKLMQFIMGLDDTYMQIRSSILSRETLFDVRSAYAIIYSEESYRIATGSVSVTSQRYVTPSSYSGSTFDTHNKNEGWHYLGSDAAVRENDRQLHLVLSTEDKENYLEHPIPVAPVAQPGHQVPLKALATHAAWIKGKRKLMCSCY
uniref:Putative zinc finger A20 and AN1 domain-containing stress-associated protein 8 n=1 Tax=Tanacetum cinerariifolium TaxID=118510 RepID=A0A699GGH1_TANCI|nr:putative zinc finger A20 and AN1 domain-containing stress-associated protein 8 [Tanacetum cinerariifolium]